MSSNRLLRGDCPPPEAAALLYGGLQDIVICKPVCTQLLLPGDYPPPEVAALLYSSLRVIFGSRLGIVV